MPRDSVLTSTIASEETRPDTTDITNMKMKSSGRSELENYL